MVGSARCPSGSRSACCRCSRARSSRCPRRARAGRAACGCAPAAGRSCRRVSVIAFVLIARAAESASAQGLTYLALVAVPPLAALALGVARRAARARARALLVAGAVRARLGRPRRASPARPRRACSRRSAASRSASLLAAVTPPRWLGAGIVAMALADTALVVSDLLQRPNDALNAAHPGGRAAAAAERGVRLGGDGLRRPVRRGGARRPARGRASGARRSCAAPLLTAALALALRPAVLRRRRAARRPCRSRSRWCVLGAQRAGGDPPRPAAARRAARRRQRLLEPSWSRSPARAR